MIFVRSFSITLSQVVGVFPHFFLDGCSASYIEILAGVSFGILIKWPSQFKRLLFIVWLHGSTLVLLYRFTLDIFLGQRMFMACRIILLWNESICFAIVVVIVQSSELYRKIDAVKALNVFTLVAMLRFFDL